VSVEELCAPWNEADQILVEGRDEAACSLYSLFHGFGIYRGRMGAWGTC
jgi:hypothetical protein